jgi:hypothetical protein
MRGIPSSAPQTQKCAKLKANDYINRFTGSHTVDLKAEIVNGVWLIGNDQ